MFQSVYKIAIAVSAAVCLGSPSTAFADTLSFATVLQDTPGPFSQPLSLAKFDTNLGTLTGISVQIDTSLNATESIYNSRTAAKRYTALNVSTPLTLTAPSVSLDATLTAAKSYAASPRTVAARQTATESLTATSTRTGSVPLSTFTAYQGKSTDTVALNLTADDTNATGTGDQGLLYSAEGNVGATIRVTYTYTATGATVTSGNAIPEPGALNLWAVGALPGALILVRRRK